MKELDLGEMFAAGAMSVADEHGMNEKDADAFAESMCKKALFGFGSRSRDDDDPENTWWNRNKKWVIPPGIGLAAFLVGADAGQNGRPDRNHFSNAASLLYQRLKALFGINDSEFWKSMTKAKRSRLLNFETPKGKSDRELSELLGLRGTEEAPSGTQGAFPLILNGRMPFGEKG